MIVAVPDEKHVRLRLPDGREAVVALDDVKDALLQDADDTAALGGREP